LSSTLKNLTSGCSVSGLSKDCAFHGFDTSPLLSQISATLQATNDNNNSNTEIKDVKVQNSRDLADSSQEAFLSRKEQMHDAFT
uniref:Uncharacterized protein n=1 Tax=Phasianus colchicus TaxID=9054 RepID=A0A669Q8L9_PHACC